MKKCTRCGKESEHTIRCLSGYTGREDYLCESCFGKAIGGNVDGKN